MQRHRWLSITGAATLGVVLLSSETAPSAQGRGTPNGPPEVLPAVAHDRSRPLRDIPALPPGTTRDDFRVRQPEDPQPGASDTALQSLAVAAMAANVQSGFDGVGEGAPFAFDVSSAPPDTVGEAGRTQYVQWVNTSFAVFDKATGAKLYGPAAGNTLWSGFPGDCATRNDGDPIVQYDQLADRWVMTQFSVRSNNFLQCVAISQTEDATGAWYRYAFSYSQFPDYPKLSVWPDAYYITFNMFQTLFRGPRVCAYDRARMLQGLSATQQCFQLGTNVHSLLPADLEGSALPPPGSPAYLLNRGANSLNLWEFRVDFATPANTTLTGPINVPVAAYSTACGGGTCIPQPGTANQLDSLGDRLMYRLGYRNLGGHEALVVNHSVAANGRTGIRWYEIDIQSGSPVIHQQSTYAPNDGVYRWMGSAAMDAAGNIAIGYSVSSSTTRPSIRFAGRESTDALNTMSAETEMRTGIGSQTGSLTRWGDYSTLSVDPVDDCTFWYTSEFLRTSGTFNWSTHIGSFKFASCDGTPPPPVVDFALGATPSSRSITAGAATSYSVSLSGTDAFTGTADLSVSGLPSGASGVFAPTAIGDGQSSTLTVTTSAGTPAGSHTLTIAGTQGTLVRTTTVTLVVAAPEAGDFTIGASPGNRNIRAGTSTSYSVSIARTGGFSDAVTLSVPTAISGVTFTFSPNPAGGSSSTLNVATTSGAATGTHSVTISATGGGMTRTTTVNLRIR